jgi:cysteinyl-tRNA synthetase
LKPSQTRNTAQKNGAMSNTIPAGGPGADIRPQESRLSVSDAFALVTIRLGRVETILQKLDINELANKIETGDEKSGGTLTNVLVKTISSRIDDLEDMMKDNISIQEHLDAVNELKNANNALKEEIMELKNSIFKIQNMVIDVNQKLLSPTKDVSVKEVDVVVDSEDTMSAEGDLEITAEIDAVSVKETIQNNDDIAIGTPEEKPDPSVEDKEEPDPIVEGQEDATDE